MTKSVDYTLADSKGDQTARFWRAPARIREEPVIVEPARVEPARVEPARVESAKLQVIVSWNRS